MQQKEGKWNTCITSNIELDFRKYAKAALSTFKEGVVRRVRDKKEEHMFLLYHYRELDQVLEELSDVYGIPLLPRSCS